MPPCHPFRPVPGQCGPNRRGPLPAPPFNPQDYWATRKCVSQLSASLGTKLDRADVVDPGAGAEAGEAADAKGTYEELGRILAKLAEKSDRATTLAGYGITDAATKTEIAGKADLVGGKVPAAQLPSYVDDVLEYDTMSAFPATGESGKIYVAKDANKTYRWSGTQYVEISLSPVLDDTVTEASPNGVRSSGVWSWVKSLLPRWLTGDYAEPATVASVEAKADKAALDAHVADTDNPHGVTAAQVGALPLVEDENGEMTAVTIGSRDNSEPVGPHSLVNGDGLVASGAGSRAEGSWTHASGAQSHAEGGGTHASGAQSHAEGGGTYASGDQSHAEGGGGTTASGVQSHAEGSGTTASGDQSHAEGGGTTASGNQSHAEGGGTTASGTESHAEGGGTIASGDMSHAEGDSTHAKGYGSHAEGHSTIANAPFSRVSGVNSETELYDDYACVWNGVVEVQYKSNGLGTFNINPAGGPAGFFIGEQSLPQVINAATAGKASLASLAPEYSATSAYSVGAIVYHDGSIYQCKAAIAEGGEAWNDGHWELRKLDGFFTESNSLLTGTIDAEVISKGTAPDAHLEAPTDERLKLVLADNSVAYDSEKALPYKLTSAIGDRVIATMTLTAASTDITLPTIAANDTTVKDFILDVTNAYAVEGVATDAGINIPRTDFKLVTRDGESLTDVTTVKAGKSAFICFTQKSPVVVDGTTYPCWCVIQLPFGDPS